MLLVNTTAGDTQTVNARLNGTVLPKFKNVLIDQAETQIDNKAPVLEVAHEAKIEIKRQDGGVLSFEINVPPDKFVHIRGLGLQTEDGKVVAYARYWESGDGLPKRVGTNFILECQYDVTGRTADEITFVYEPFDVLTLKNEILQHVIENIASVGGDNFETTNGATQ